MMPDLSKRSRQMGWLFIVAAFLVIRVEFGSLKAASGSSGGIAGAYPMCDVVCGEAVSCDEECWYFPPELPANETTCGNYVGDPWGGVGTCLGECGDDYCNVYNEEDKDSCYEDCGWCGDDVCSGPEDLGNCAQDCHECGDTICSGGFETCSNCGTDCNPTAASCGAGETPGEICGEDQVENGAGYCCDIERQIDGVGECSLCAGPNQQCVQIYYLGIPITWVCVGTGDTCGTK